MRVHLGSDHAGFDLKNHLVASLRERGHDVIDHGPVVYDGLDDYPAYCLRVAEAVAADGGESRGVVIGGSGNGEQIAANKVSGVRAALGWSQETVALSRGHNDANVLAVGARMHSQDEAAGFVSEFLATPYSGEERHARRIEMLRRYEESGGLPPLPDA